MIRSIITNDNFHKVLRSITFLCTWGTATVAIKATRISRNFPSNSNNLVVRQMHELVVFMYQEVNMRVAEVMTRNVIAVPVEATIVEAAELMKTHNIGFLPVVADEIVVGVVTDRDLVVRGMCERANPYLTPVRSVMSNPPFFAMSTMSSRTRPTFSRTTTYIGSW